jgi:hypothetical protein
LRSNEGVESIIVFAPSNVPPLNFIGNNII